MSSRSGVRKTYLMPQLHNTSWTRSRRLCGKYGLEFTHFDTAEEFRAVSRLFEKSYLEQIVLLIGGYRKHGRWIWAETLAEASYPLPWARDEPREGKNCMAMNTINHTYELWSIDCEMEFGYNFFCEKFRGSR